jgi:hypothetical protein
VKYIYIFFALLIGCNSLNSENTHTDLDSNHSENVATKLPGTDTLMAYKFYNTNLELNPFVTLPDTTPFKECIKTLDYEDIFNCVINQFEKISVPIELGAEPDQDIKYLNNAQLYDSIFILHCLQDSEYFNSPPDMRTYGYTKGRVIEKNNNYILIVIPMGFSVGFNYDLCSFKLDGTPIAKKSIGGTWVGEYKTYGFVSDTKHFEIHRIEFGLDKETGILNISKKINSKFQINDQGEFINY